MLQNRLPTNPVRNLFTVQTKTKGMVSKIYQFLVIPDHFSLPVEWAWKRDCPDLDKEFDWHVVWSDISLVLRNPDHQQIHYDFIHRTYLTPVTAPHENGRAGEARKDCRPRSRTIVRIFNNNSNNKGSSGQAQATEEKAK